MKEDHKTHNH